MTVCVGPICAAGNAIVVAADRMMTYGSPMNLQVETPIKKIVAMPGRTVVLFSGSVADGEDVIRRARAQVLTATASAKDVSDACASAYQEVKRQRAEDTLLRPAIGGGYDVFQHLVSQSAASQSIQQLLGLLMQHNLQLDLLVAGIDQDGAHLSAVTHPGQSLPLDTVSCSAIGSGGLHANIRLSLGRQHKDLNLSATVYNVYAAKVAAEVAPGVCRLTDMAIIRPDAVQFFDEDVYTALAEIHNERPGLDATGLEKVAELCKRYTDEPG